MSGVKNFNPDKGLPSLTGKVIFITGGTAGLGSTSIQKLAKHNPAHIYFTGRNVNRAKNLINEVKKITPTAQLTFIQCDFASLFSIKTGLKQFTHTRLDVLMCNAGIMAQPPKLSKDGYELQFAVNHLAHALIIKTLLPILLTTATLPISDVRLILLTSTGYRGNPKGGIQFSTLNTVQDFGALGYWQRYGQSKLANILYSKELARRYGDKGILRVSVHPGVVETNLLGDLGFMDKMLVYITNPGKVLGKEEGVLSQLWVAAGAERREMRNGAFYMPVGVESDGKLSKVARNQGLAGELWGGRRRRWRGFDVGEKIECGEPGRGSLT